jgi:hypothetical protein
MRARFYLLLYRACMHFVCAQFVVLRSDTMEVVHEGRESRKSVTDIRFSPDGTTLGVASADSKIYLHDVQRGFVLRASCTRHNKYVQSA